MNRTLSDALVGGLLGAVTLTVLHETTRRLQPHAPRMDVLGMRAIAKAFLAAEHVPPPRGRLHKTALVGDLISNSLYYSLVAAGGREHAWSNAALLGTAAGLGAALLPPHIGLGEQPAKRTPQTEAMTVALYLSGALATAAYLSRS